MVLTRVDVGAQTDAAVFKRLQNIVVVELNEIAITHLRIQVVDGGHLGSESVSSSHIPLDSPLPHPELGQREFAIEARVEVHTPMHVVVAVEMQQLNGAHTQLQLQSGVAKGCRQVVFGIGREHTERRNIFIGTRACGP